jgi:hypothetical protein
MYTIVMKFYIKDTTIGNNPIYFNTINEVVKHLEGSVQRKFRQNRTQYMQNLEDLGHGSDDRNGKTFTESMSQYFDIGVVKPDRLVRCNIHEVAIYSKYRTEMGD